MKILVVVLNLRGDGAEQVVFLPSREWAKSREVTIALFDASEAVCDYGGRIVDIRDPVDTWENPSTFIRKTHDIDMRSMPLLGLIRRKLPGIIKDIYNIGMRSAWLSSLLRREHPDRIISNVDPNGPINKTNARLVDDIPPRT